MELQGKGLELDCKEEGIKSANEECRKLHIFINELETRIREKDTVHMRLLSDVDEHNALMFSDAAKNLKEMGVALEKSEEMRCDLEEQLMRSERQVCQWEEIQLDLEEQRQQLRDTSDMRDKEQSHLTRLSHRKVK